MGASSDCIIFKNSNFCKKLEGNHLNIPGPRPLPSEDNGTPLPFVIVGDEAFACHSMSYDHSLAEIWMLPDVYIITD